MVWGEKEEKAYQAKYREDHKEKLREYSARYYQEHKEEFRQYRKKRREERHATIAAGDQTHPECSVETCHLPVYGKGWCEAHYARNYMTGDIQAESPIGSIRNSFAITHGMTNSPEYHAYYGMKQRCNNPSSTSYRNYGGRGIKVCQQWNESFETFLKDVGPRPSAEYSLDRINVNGNYEPDNVRWATAAQQNANKRKKNTGFAATYQQQTKNTAIYPGQGEFDGVIYCAMGAAGEVGEICNKVQKLIRDGYGEISIDVKRELIQEMGDVLWFISQLATELNVDLTTIMQENIWKLTERNERGVIKGSGDNR